MTMIDLMNNPVAPLVVIMGISVFSSIHFAISVHRLERKHRQKPVDLDAVVARAPYHKLEEALKKPPHLTFDQNLLSEARSLGVNLSQAAEAGLRDAIQKAKSEVGRRENTESV